MFYNFVAAWPTSQLPEQRECLLIYAKIDPHIPKSTTVVISGLVSASVIFISIMVI